MGTSLNHKTGRNEPCHCGSGKKYKKCCLGQGLQEAYPPNDFLWNKLKKERLKAIKSLMAFVAKNYTLDVFHEAWEDFHMKGTTEVFEPGCFQSVIFMPWFFYKWLPCQEHLSPQSHSLIDSEKTIAENFLYIHGKEIPQLQEQYILASLHSPFSFYDIIESQPNWGVKIKDIFTYEEYNVIEKLGSETLQRGDIVCGSLVSLNGVTTFEAMSPITIPPKDKILIVTLRKYLSQGRKISQQDLRDYEPEIISTYVLLYESLMYPPKPIFCNTDGESFVPQKLIYSISDPHEVFEKLYDLDIMLSKEEILQEASLDSNSRVQEITLTWNKKKNKKIKSWTNTILGRIELKPNKLIAHVNSHERSDRIRQILEQRLKDLAVLQQTVVEDIDKLLDQEKHSSSNSLSRKRNEELNQKPEVQEFLKKAAEEQWQGWLTTKVPVLGNRTPKQASRSKEGRELLESLFLQFERDKDSANSFYSHNNEVFKNLKAQLNLTMS